jgi:PiT family inorganic phosphate transporter
VENDLILVLVVITALAFDFTNGFHDTGNAMATSIATGALPPRVAVALSGLLNLVGAFLSLAVAATIASGLVNTADVTLPVVAAGLAGGIIWNRSGRPAWCRWPTAPTTRRRRWASSPWP